VIPHLEAGEVVITDRYVPSALVMQQLDGVDPEYLWRINAKASRPHLAVILDAEPAVVSEQLRDRGPHNRLQKLPSSAHIEWHHYREVTRRLADAGWQIQKIDCSTTTVSEVAEMVHGRLKEIAAPETPTQLGSSA
jgi:dTMP kinase